MSYLLLLLLIVWWLPLHHMLCIIIWISCTLIIILLWSRWPHPLMNREWIMMRLLWEWLIVLLLFMEILLLTSGRILIIIISTAAWGATVISYRMLGMVTAHHILLMVIMLSELATCWCRLLVELVEILLRVLVSGSGINCCG